MVMTAKCNAILFQICYEEGVKPDIFINFGNLCTNFVAFRHRMYIIQPHMIYMSCSYIHPNSVGFVGVKSQSALKL
jgi:hypothetical protein